MKYASRCVYLLTQEEILKDCTQMVPDTRRRLNDGTSDLDAYMVRSCNPLTDSKELAKIPSSQMSIKPLYKLWRPHRMTRSSIVQRAAVWSERCGGFLTTNMPPPAISVRFLGTSTTPLPTRNYSRYACVGSSYAACSYALTEMQ